ncbi:MAG: DUF1080 domain-containing protein [Akkermansiaceae bacterium]|nr:DUF1080 domain-containing protein [Akkermansiaceae bacterium]NNM29935.1 DUF1080 domain-containing protein [Akkermansiaceae bacterium]
MKQCIAAILAALCAAPLHADHHGKKPPANSNERARPEVITPGTASTEKRPGRAPSDAVILFDGTGLDGFAHKKGPAKWKVGDGYFEVVPGTGEIISRQSFGDAQLHIEWATPAEVKGKGQGRGNSGVFIGNYCEVQVLDSFQNDTYPGGQAGALYGKTPPLVNAARKPGTWQSYDIIVHAARDGQPARITVLHNGVVLHHAFPLGNKDQPWQLRLQDHGNPVRYRNIWVRELQDYK